MSSTIKNIPFNKPRASVPKEGLYLSYWNRYSMEKVNEYDLDSDTTNFDVLYKRSGAFSKQRFAMVAASFITYMGCNLGIAFTDEAEDFHRRIDGTLNREDAFIAKWALYNKRTSYINNNSIPMEAMIGRKVFNQRARHGEGAWVNLNINQLTVEDYEIVNVMVRWWAGEDAIAMRNYCKPIAQKMTTKILENLYRKN